LQPVTELSERRERLLPILRELRVPAFLVSAPANVRYLSGFTGSNGSLILTADAAVLFTDPRYQTQAPLESDCAVKIAKRPMTAEFATWLNRRRIASLAFEENRIAFELYQKLKTALPKVRLKPAAAAVDKLRMVKSPSEIATIRASVELNSLALDHALKAFAPAMTEIDLAAEIEYRMRRLGADGVAFETIVASGDRSALPHARPTDHPIKTDELLLIDMGASVAGYASDMTRTYAVGKVDSKARRMYRAVLESQLAAIAAVRPGVTCGAVDRAARGVLRTHGFDKLFIHSTGHGLGLEIHEPPRLGKKEKVKLEPGMAITIEPGVYVEGLGGIRIEDTVVVTAQGCEVLTPTRKELVVL
jgi:Xaa-Pro aminopeptidase